MTGMRRSIILAATALLAAEGALADAGLAAQQPWGLQGEQHPERTTMQSITTAKPRFSYTQFIAHQAARPHTIAAVCRWRIEEAKKPGARALGESMFYTLRRISREELGTKALPLKPQDLVDHCRERIGTGVVPATVNQDITALRSSLRDYVDSHELPSDWMLVFQKAQRRLQKEQLVGTAKARERLPLLEELDLLRTHFTKQNEHPLTRTDMVLVVDGGILLGRRISELCRIQRQHVDIAKRTYWVYDLKNGRGKGYNGEAALIEGAWEFIEERLAAIPNEPTARLFPYNSKTCSQRYTLAKKSLQREHPSLFHDLRLHDNRAASFVRLLRKGYTVEQIQKGFSLHKNLKTLVGHYVRLKAEDLHAGPLGAPVRERVTVASAQA
jgi:integrase